MVTRKANTPAAGVVAGFLASSHLRRRTRGRYAQTWDVEDELVAVALFGDVTIDLSQTRSTPAEVAIEAYAILRDVDVLVPEGTHVELSGGVVRGDLRNEVPPSPSSSASTSCASRATRCSAT